MDSFPEHESDITSWYHIDSTNNIFLRSGLYSLSQKGEREYLKDKIIETSPGLYIQYTGERLTQHDRDVSIAMKKVSIELRTGVDVIFSEKDIFKKLRYKAYGKTDIDLIHKSLFRMFTSTYCFDLRGSSFEGKNAEQFQWDSEKKHFILKLNEKWVNFFCKNNGNSFISLRERMSLPRGFCRWLHSYWSSYSSIPATHIDELRKLCGSNEKLRGNFKKSIVHALQHLEAMQFIKPNWIVSTHGYIQAEKIIK